MLLAHVAPVKEEANLGAKWVLKAPAIRWMLKAPARNIEDLLAAFELWWKEGEPRSSARLG